MNARVRGAATIVAAVFLLAFAAPAGAALGSPPRPPKARVGNVAVSNRNPQRGGEIDVSSQGWRPGGLVMISFAGTDLLRTTADDHGVVHARVVIPRDAPQGLELLAVTGAAANGVPQEIVTGLAVVVDRPPHTPSRPWGVALLLAAGAAILMLASQRTERVGRARQAPAG